MRFILSIILGSFFLLSPLTLDTLSAQREIREKLSKEEVAKKYSAEEVSSTISTREFYLLDNTINDNRSTLWSRDIYRIIEDSHAENSAFFLPEESGPDFVNLFSMLLNLLNNNQIVAYRFDSETTTIEEKGEITLPEIFDVNNIPFTLRLDNTISFSRYDLPSSEVQSYYIKERWFFDAKTGKYDVVPVAICPVLHHRESYEFLDSPILKNPLFWVHFDEIAAYLHKAVTPAAISTLGKVSNNVSLYDVFRSRLFIGDVYQVGVRNLMKYANSPEELKIQQARIEAELQEIVNKFNKVR